MVFLDRVLSVVSACVSLCMLLFLLSLYFCFLSVVCRVQIDASLHSLLLCDYYPDTTAAHTCKILVSQTNEVLISRLVNEGSYVIIDPFCKKRRVAQPSDSDDEVSDSDDEDKDKDKGKDKRRRVIVPATDDEDDEQSY